MLKAVKAGDKVQDGKRFMLRSAPHPVAGLALRAVGVARELYG
jgi:hypothetical protein